MEIEEISAYKKRLEKEYGELLSYRQMILNQITIDEKMLIGLKLQREAMGQAIMERINDETLALSDLKNQKAGFVEMLKTEKEMLDERNNSLAEREEAVKKELALSEAVKVAQRNEYDGIEDEKANLVKLGQLNAEKEKEINKRLEELKQRVNDNAETTMLATENLNELKAAKEEITKAEAELKARKEIIKKQEEMLGGREKKLNEERAHLESQQQDLKLAFDEARKRNLL